MGKSGARKKKSNVDAGNATNSSVHSGATSAANSNGGLDLDSSLFLKRAYELKEEGNKRFQDKDYVGALEQYDKALKLTPKSHPDRAVFHSNKAACLMQMKPIDYETVISECTLSLQVQPRFVRALLRRARAFEAIGKHEMAMQDVQQLLAADPNHRDALEISRRLRTALGPRQDAQQDLHSRPSPAALGASAVRGAPIAGLGPCLPARPVSKKLAQSSAGPVTSPPAKAEKSPATENGWDSRHALQNLAQNPVSGSTKRSETSTKGGKDGGVTPSVRNSAIIVPQRPLKLVYDHDIRLAQMPIKCTFKELRDIVSKRFPSSKSVLIKYKDSDGDLVTITCTSELRLAEKSLPKAPESDVDGAIEMLRLHIVEVSQEQEPELPEEEDEKHVENEDIKKEENVSESSLDESVLEPSVEEANKSKKNISLETESKEVEMDDWLFDFAQLFRSHVGIDPDAHIDLHELGMELCSEALEESVTSEEAQILFEKAALKFQEVAALAFFNWGNVYMCAARKRIPLDESAGNDVVSTQLQSAYDWVKEKYTLAREKYEEALSVKSDFYEGLLALGQQQFEMAKLHWSYALAKKTDLSKWESGETLDLFNSAEQKMTSATEMWEKLEEQRVNELKNPSKKEDFPKRKKKHGESSEAVHQLELSPEEAAEQAAVMRSQIHLFWGNMLFERSQVECKLGIDGWKKNLETAVERFKLAGASDADIATVMKNHCSNEAQSANNNGGNKNGHVANLK